MNLTRRHILKLASLAAVPIPGVSMGEPVKVLFCLTLKGLPVTVPIEADFYWDSDIKFSFGEGNNFRFDGMRVLLPDNLGVREHSFEPITMLPNATLDFTYQIRKA
jgi:hypothetical protein